MNAWESLDYIYHTVIPYRPNHAVDSCYADINENVFPDYEFCDHDRFLVCPTDLPGHSLCKNDLLDAHPNHAAGEPQEVDDCRLAICVDRNDAPELAAVDVLVTRDPDLLADAEFVWHFRLPLSASFNFVINKSENPRRGAPKYTE